MKSLVFLLCWMLTAAAAADEEVERHHLGPFARWPVVAPAAAIHQRSTTHMNTTTSTTSTTTTRISTTSPSSRTTSPFTRTTTTTTTSRKTTSISTTTSTISLSTRTGEPSCFTNSTKTYYGSQPETVYVTTDTSIEYTITAGTQSFLFTPLPAVEIETPPQPCGLTVIPPLPNPTSIKTIPTEPTMTLPVTSTSSVTTTAAATYSPIPTKNRYTTIVVTRKTSIPVVFRPGAQTPIVTLGPLPGATTLPGLPLNDPPRTHGNSPKPSGNSNGGSGGGHNGPMPGDGDGDSGTGPKSPGGKSGNSHFPFYPGFDDTLSKIGSIVTSGLNKGPNGPASPATPTFRAAPAIVTIDGVVVTIQPTAVVVSGSTIMLPTTRGDTYPSIVLGDGRTVQVGPSQIITPHTTYDINPAVSTITQPASTITAGRITLTVGPSYAIIGGTTYRLGPNITPTTLTVDSTVITLNSNGIVLPSSTLVPPMTLAIPQPQPDHPIYKIVVVNGMTFSIDASEAIISGTTYRIGHGFDRDAPETAVVDGKTITLGEMGVVVSGQTITPTSIAASETVTLSSAANSESGPSLVVATETGKADGGDGSSGDRGNAAAAPTVQVGLVLGLLPLAWLLVL